MTINELKAAIEIKKGVPAALISSGSTGPAMSAQLRPIDRRKVQTAAGAAGVLDRS